MEEKFSVSFVTNTILQSYLVGFWISLFSFLLWHCTLKPGLHPNRRGRGFLCLTRILTLVRSIRDCDIEDYLNLARYVAWRIEFFPSIVKSSILSWGLNKLALVISASKLSTLKIDTSGLGFKNHFKLHSEWFLSPPWGTFSPVSIRKFKLFMHSSACCPVTSLLHKKKMPLAVSLQERVYGIIKGVVSL